MTKFRGTFITFEGSEGSGKSTQIALLEKYLHKRGFSVLFLREPGGVKVSEQIRKILLDPQNRMMGKECETLLYMAARAQLVSEQIEPALRAGKIILCDRFLDSTVVYQGYGCGVDIAWIKKLGEFATKGIVPDLTISFDIAVKRGLARIKNRPKDRIEQRQLSYHDRVRRGYLNLARKEPSRIKLISANQSKEEIQILVQKHVNQLLHLK